MTRTFTWEDANGNTTELSEANGYRVLVGVQGLDAPPIVNTVDDYTNWDGAALANRRRGVRQVVLPLFLRHPSRVQTRVHELVAMLHGPGELTHADGTNTRRLRNVIYEAGLGGDLGRQTSLPDTATAAGWRKFVVSLLALDPWWYGVAVAANLPVGTQTGFSAAVDFNAGLPFNGGSSVPITVVGDGEAFPVITVYGPATSVVLGCRGLEWETAVTLDADDVLVVDTRPGSRGPRLNGVDVSWSLLTEASRVWTFQPGINQVNVGVTGSTGGTSIELQYDPRYLTP